MIYARDNQSKHLFWRIVTRREYGYGVYLLYGDYTGYLYLYYNTSEPETFNNVHYC